MSIKRKKDPKVLVVAGQSIGRSTKETVRINVGRLPSGTRIYLYAHVFRAPKPGPVFLITAGMHGDEINGVEIVRRTIESGMFDSLIKGTVIAVPIVNVYGFINFSREVPDGKDVNRSFPGNMSGSLAARIARTITGKILPISHLGLDLHTGGGPRYNFPQIRYTKGNAEAEKLAKAFAPPVILPKPTILKSFRRSASKSGIPILVYEGGESLRYDGLSLVKGMNGIGRLLFHLGMADTMINPMHPVLMFQSSSWIRAAQAGLFLWKKPSGLYSRKNECLGFIRDPYGLAEYKVYSKKDGFLIGHNNAPVVNQGDALYHVGYERQEII